MTVSFAKFITKKWAVLASKIDKLFIVIGIIASSYANELKYKTRNKKASN